MLEESVRAAVTSYVLKHVVPKSVKPRPRTAMEWFAGRFSFIGDEQLRKHLAEALYQARFVGRIHEALGLRGNFNRAFVKQQVMLYASIYEATIDYFLELNESDPACRSLFASSELRPASGVLGKNTTLTLTDGDAAHEIIPARQVTRRRKLQEVRFSDRLAAAVAIGLVSSNRASSIQELYDARNNIHIKRASEKHFTPDARRSSAAYHELSNFLRKAARWASKQ